MQVSRNNVAVAPSSEWRDDWNACPRGAKMLLLTEAGIAIIGRIADSTKGYLAWAPLPDRFKPGASQAAVPPNEPTATPFTTLEPLERVLLWALLRRAGGRAEISQTDVQNMNEAPGTVLWHHSADGHTYCVQLGLGQ